MTEPKLPPSHDPEDSDPQSSDRENPGTQRCANCGTAVTAKFCGECGQLSGVPSEGLRDLVLKETSGADRFGSLVTTLVWLLRRPGDLILEFLAGRRTRFVRPTQIYSATAGCYVLLFTLVQPLQITVEDFEVTIRQVSEAFPAVAEKLEGRDVELVRDRFIDRLNLIFPIVALVTIPLYVLLFRMLFGGDWRRHTTTVIYFFSIAWLAGIVTMPLLKFAPQTGTAVQLLILFGYWAAIQHRVYPGEVGSDGRPRFRFGAFLTVLGADLALNVVVGAITGPAAFALCVASFR